MRLHHILCSSLLFSAAIGIGSASAQSVSDCELSTEGLYTGILATTKETSQVCIDERNKQQSSGAAAAAQSGSAAPTTQEVDMTALGAVASCANKRVDDLLPLVRNAMANGAKPAAAIENLSKRYCRATNEINVNANNTANLSGGNVGPISVGSSSQSSALASAQARAQAQAEQQAVLDSVNQTRNDVGPLAFDLWYYRDSALTPHMSWFHINQALGFTYGDNAVFKRPDWGLKITQQLGLRVPKTPFVLHAVGALTLPIANASTASDALHDWGIVVGGRLTWHALRNRDLALFPTLGYDYDAYQGNRFAPHKVVAGADILIGGWRFRHKVGIKVEASCPITADLAHPHCEGYFALLLPSQGTHH